ncbi:MAG TPA: MFS transporter [Vicinamibacteria bacterium]|nr:MFS transporter [Vicinamibacteria bacterium]
MSSSSAKPERPYHVLRHRDFRLLWGSQLVSLTGTQMQVVALNWHVYLLTHSPLALGMVGLSRVVPTIVFSLWGGIVADRRDRRRVMFLAQSAMALFSVALAVLTVQGRASLAVLYGLNAATAAASAFDNPARQALVPRLVPPGALPSALSLNLAMFHAATIGGPGVAGLVLAAGSRGLGSVAAIYAFNAFSFVVVLLALALMRTSGAPEDARAAEEHPWQSLKAGLRFVFTTPLMVWTTGLDFVATFFAGALSMLPIFADQVLHVGAAGYGWLVAAPALGALAGSVYTALVHLPRRQGRLFLWAVMAYGLFTVAWGLGTRYLVVFLALAAGGLADLVSTVIRQHLRQLITPDALRGRMTSVNMIFFMGGPQLGELEAGLVASFFASAAVGARVAVVTGGLATLLAGALVFARSRLLRDYQVDPGEQRSA